MNANGGIEHMHNNYPTWTSMFSHAHAIKNHSRAVIFSPSNSGLLVDGGWFTGHALFPNSSTFEKNNHRVINLDPHTTSNVEVAPSTTQTLLEANVFGFPRRAKPSAVA